MMLRKPLTLAALLFALTACGGTVPEGATSTDVGGDGTIISLTMPSGLVCDVFDTYKGGTVSCDFNSFTVPGDWKPGVVETLDAADGAVTVTYFEDKHFCATFDGFESGGISCFYPNR